MGTTEQHIGTLSIFVYETVFVSEQITVEVIIVSIDSCNNLSFGVSELAKLREVLRISIGDHVNSLTEEYLIEFGTAMLRTTVIILKARYMQSKTRLGK